MAGGTWTGQNKIRPGAYINIKSKSRSESTLSDRGIVTLPLELPWGPEKKIVSINADDNLFDVIGIDINDSAALLIRETFKRAKTLLLYRLNTGTKATVTAGGITVTAKYGGTQGNNIIITIQNNIDNDGKFDVTTMLNGIVVDRQTISTIAELVSNNFVAFSGTGVPQVTAGSKLIGGTNGTVTNQDYMDYLTAIELYKFNTMGIVSKDNAIKALVTSFVKRLREQEGRKVQAVLENYPEADYEGVLSVKNGVVTTDGTITSDKAVAFVAGATAGADVNKSNTYTVYGGAIDVDIRYPNKDIVNALKNGEIVFTISNGSIVIEQDINTLKTFTKEKDKSFRKNRVIRTLDAINNDVKLLWETRYIGKGDNDTDGRNLFKKDVIKYLETLQGIHAVENVVPEDVEILQGDDKETIVARVGAQPVDSPEKLYMEVEVR